MSTLDLYKIPHLLTLEIATSVLSTPMKAWINRLPCELDDELIDPLLSGYSRMMIKNTIPGMAVPPTKSPMEFDSVSSSVIDLTAICKAQ